jgi:amino-acid N-acetyltransferase
MVTISDATADNFAAVTRFLEANKLPEAGLEVHASDVLVARNGSTLLATAALEIYDDNALLRSIAVEERARGTGLGQSITRAAIDRARQKGVTHLFLLTETAPDFFRRFGFVDVDRDAVPTAIRSTVEFASACPASAPVMVLVLENPEWPKS